jgi:uncharacterized protein YecT (DUF1311 family)
MNLYRVVVLVGAVFVFSGSVSAQTRKKNADPCTDTSNMSQQQLNQCAAKQMEAADSKLESLLRQLGIRKDDPAQKAWEAYRDAQLAALYPPEDVGEFGSVYPMCYAILRKVLTEGRIRDLKSLTTKEGDACGGYRAATL